MDDKIKELENFTSDALSNELKRRRAIKQREKEAEIKALAKDLLKLIKAFEEVTGEKVEKFRSY